MGLLSHLTLVFVKGSKEVHIKSSRAQVELELEAALAQSLICSALDTTWPLFPGPHPNVFPSSWTQGLLLKPVGLAGGLVWAGAYYISVVINLIICWKLL